jgi:heptosyltransferase-1
VLDTQGLIKSAVIARQAELAVNGRRLGYAAEAAREPFAARFYDAGFAIPKSAHAIERNRWLAAAAFDYVLDQPLDYGISATALVADWLPAQPYVVFFSGTSRADKLWPEADWIALAQALNTHVVLPAGSAEERERTERLALQMPLATVAPALGVADLAGLLSGAQLVVGLDTGLTHLAAALNKPTLALFSGSDPQLTGVLAGGDSVTAINLGNKGAPPSADEAVAAAQRLL